MLQAKGFDATPDTSYMPASPRTEVNRFPYGWRYVLKPLPTGDELYDQIPLTVNDLLNPQEGDQVPQSNEHFQTILDLASTLKTHYAHDPSLGVFGDLIMDWGIPGLSGPAPDIAIVPNLKDKDAARGTFKVVQEGTRPCFVIEVMSPNYHGDDTAKVSIYERAGITEYLLIKPRFEQRVPSYRLQGYRLTNGVYRQIPTDTQGRWLSHTLQLRLLTPTEAEVARRQEQTARLAAEAHAQAEAKARAQTEAARQQEQIARLAAEAHAQAEAKARAQTEAARQQEQIARLTAEARADAEAKARAELEQRLQELENLLKSRT